MPLRTFSISISPQELSVKNLLFGSAIRGSRTQRTSPRITGSLLIVTNERAGNGLAIQKTRELRDVIARKPIPIEGRVEWMTTHPNPRIRHERIRERIRHLMRESDEVTVVAMGGNTMANDAMRVASELGASVVPGPGGRVGDLQRMAGTPDDVSRLPLHIATAARIDMYGLEVLYDTELLPAITYHGLTIGEGSGGMYAKLDKRYETEAVTRWDYLYGLLGAIATSRAMRISVNGETPITTGEMIACAALKQGSVANVPMPTFGARLFFPYPSPLGAANIVEGLVRGGLVNAGFQYWAGPSRGLLTLPKERQVDLLPGESVHLKIYDMGMRAFFVRGTHTGDHVGGAHEVTITVSDTPVTVLADPQSEIMVHGGWADAAFPFDGVTNGAVGKAVRFPRNMAHAASFVKSLLRALVRDES